MFVNTENNMKRPVFIMQSRTADKGSFSSIGWRARS